MAHAPHNVSVRGFSMEIRRMTRLRSTALVFLLVVAPGAIAQEKKKVDKLPDAISYYKDVRPIVQQHCQGCHQPAMAKGGYVMTDFAELFKKSEKEIAGVVARNL